MQQSSKLFHLNFNSCLIGLSLEIQHGAAPSLIKVFFFPLACNNLVICVFVYWIAGVKLICFFFLEVTNCIFFFSFYDKSQWLPEITFLWIGTKRKERIK